MYFLNGIVKFLYTGILDIIWLSCTNNLHMGIFETIQLSNTDNFYIWPIDVTVKSTFTLGHCGPSCDGNEGVLYTFQITIRCNLVS